MNFANINYRDPSTKVQLFYEFAREQLEPLLVEGRVEAPRDHLVEVANTLCMYAGPMANTKWPAGSTRMLTVLGELAACLICESRSPVPPTYCCWRNLLQRFHGHLLEDIDGTAPSKHDWEQITCSFCAIVFVAMEQKILLAAQPAETDDDEK